ASAALTASCSVSGASTAPWASFSVAPDITPRRPLGLVVRAPPDTRRARGQRREKSMGSGPRGPRRPRSHAAARPARRERFGGASRKELARQLAGGGAAIRHGPPRTGGSSRGQKLQDKHFRWSAACRH